MAYIFYEYFYEGIVVKCVELKLTDTLIRSFG